MATKSLQSPVLSARQAIATRIFWILIIFVTLTGFAQSAIMVHEVPYLTSVGMPRELAGWVFLGITGLSLTDRLGLSWVEDMYDKRYLLAIGAALQSLGMLVFARISSPWTLIPFVLLYSPGYSS